MCRFTILSFTAFNSASLFLSVACSDSNLEENTEADDTFLIFGVYHGFCIGDCWRLFKLENGQLFADNFDFPVDGVITFSNMPMSDAQYQDALVLKDIPDDVTGSDKDIYGCPDCADQGGYYLEFLDEGQRRVVNFDTRFSSFDNKSIENYLTTMSEIILKLEE